MSSVTSKTTSITMKEYWEITRDRGVETLAVWYLDAEFELVGVTMAEHTTRVAALETLAQARDSAEGDLADAREAREDFFAKIANVHARASARTPFCAGRGC